ncbi:MAG: hypothetical protein IPJ09_03260 [Saprospiraceae bacterium]|nr:hypothetical protein [Saprospiraceae bacterium]
MNIVTEQLVDCLIAKFKAAIEEVLIEKESESPTSKLDLGNTRYLTRIQVSKYLNIGLSTVDLWARIGKLNKLDLDGSPRFDRQE